MTEAEIAGAKGAKAKAKANRLEKGGYTKSGHGYKGGYNNVNSNYNHHNGSYKGGGKFVNKCDSQSFAPQSQRVHQNPGEGNRLMTTTSCRRCASFPEF